MRKSRLTALGLALVVMTTACDQAADTPASPDMDPAEVVLLRTMVADPGSLSEAELADAKGFVATKRGADLFERVRAESGDSESSTITPMALSAGAPAYTVIPFPYRVLPAPGNTNYSLDGCDDCVSTVPIGFDFEFFGQTYNTMTISTNGFMQPGSGTWNSGCCSGFQIPQNDGINGVIAPVWIDLNPRAGGRVTYETFGVAPARIFVVRWNAQYYSSSNSVDVSVAIFETANIIEMQTRYLQPAGSWTRTFTQGIENQDGTLAYALPGRVRSNISPLSNDGVLFIPGPSNAAPTANSGGPYTGDEGSAVSFDGSASSDPDGDPLTYAWTFGDGSIGSGPNPSHSYGDNGTYAVTLTVTDTSGESNTANTSVTVSNVAPTADAGADGGIVSGDAFSFSGSATDPGAADGPFAWTIDWGDGTSTSGSSADGSASDSHIYLVPGDYDVTWTVTDKDGGSGSDAATVTVTRLNVGAMVSSTVNPRSNGVIPVALLTADGFDAMEADVSSLAFGTGEAGEAHDRLHDEDVDGDGDMDAVLHFRTRDSGVSCGDTSMTLTGVTAGGVYFTATSAITTSGCNGGGKKGGR